MRLQQQLRLLKQLRSPANNLRTPVIYCDRGDFMICSVSELRQKEIVDTKTGAILGRADDIRFDTETANILSMTIYGRPKLFGFLGRDSDLSVKFEDISLIGRDAILVTDSQYLPHDDRRGERPAIDEKF